MAERKLDLARIMQTKPNPEAWGGKGDATGMVDDEKGLMGSLDDSKDQLTSENSFPLSPQWLYSKNSDSKVGNSAASGDTRLPNSLSYGSSADSVQKEPWRPDGPPDKKDWRRAVPDVENSRRWRDEERETGSLGRRDRKKEGDRETDHRKNDRRSEIASARDSGESRTLPSSDRWHEVTGRSTGLENRRDSKWSSRWGPEEKETRTDRKIDGDKEDQIAEKQTFLSSNRPSESETRDKWRPRHRLEIHSGASTVYRAAPGFGLDRGRSEASQVGFALGRGRGSLLGGLSQHRTSSAGPIGAAPLSRSYADQGRSGLFAELFRYPRGKLLDIYRKQKMLPDFEIVPDGFDTPPMTQSKSMTPLAFVSPDPTEESLLEDISKGKVTGSEVLYSTSREQKANVDYSEIEATSYPILSAADASTEVSGVTLNPSFSDTKFDAEICKVSDHFAAGNYKLGPKQHLDEKDAGTMSAAPYDISIKLPDDSISLFESSFAEEIPINKGDKHESTEVKHLELASHEEWSLFYQDPQGDIQGPFLGVDIISWFEQGFFGLDLPVCLSDAPEGTPFRPLGEVMPHLKFRFNSTMEVYSEELCDPFLDTSNDKFEVIGSLASNFVDQSLKTAAPVSDSMVSHECQPSVLDVRGYMETPPTGRTLVSELEASATIPASESHTLHDFPGQDTEEVLYTGRCMNEVEKSLEMTANDESNSSCANLGHQFLSSEIGQPHMSSHKNHSDNDINPLGLLWSELEGSHSRQPISSTMAGIDDPIRNLNPSVLDPLLYMHKQDQFNPSSNQAFPPDAWPSASIQSNRSNKIQDGIDAAHFPHFEDEFSHLSIQDQLLLHQLQKQQLQEHLPSHQHMHLGESFVVPEQGSLHHRANNQSMLDIEHLIKLQQLQEQQHHLQRLHEQQQLQQQQQQLQQQQLYQQMQLLKQQQQQEQQQQLLIEHMLQRQAREALLRDGSLDQILLRQHIARELEHQPHHFQRNQDLVLEQFLKAKLGQNLHHEQHNDLLDVLSRQKHMSTLSLEEQIFLRLQQEQLQARQLSLASRHKRGMEEDRHVGNVWSVDESGQFMRTAASAQHPHLNRLNQMDYIQSLQPPSPFEQAGLLEQNLMLHERMQQNPYERNTHPFDSSIHMSRSPPEPNADVLNVIARLQGLDIAEIRGHMHPPVQSRQFHPVNPHDHHISNQLFRPRLDVIDGQWADSNGQQRPNNLVEAQLNQLHYEAERQKRDLRGSLYNMESTSWAALAGNENIKHGIDDFFQQQLVLQPSQPLELLDTTAPSFEDRDPNWFTNPSLDNSFAEGSNLNKVFMQQDVVGNPSVEIDGGDYDLSGELALRTRSSLSIEQNQFFHEADEIEKELAVDPVVNDSSGDRVDFLDLKDGKRLKQRNARSKRSTRGKAPNNPDQAVGSFSEDHEVQSSAPIRHTSLGSNAGGLNFYNYETSTDNVYGEGMSSSRSLRILDRGSDSASLKHAQDPLTLSTQGSLSEFISAPTIEAKNPSGFPSSEASASGILKDLRFRRTSSTDIELPETSFIDIIKSSKKPAESETHPGSSHDLLESGQGVKTAKKKGKKGRQIDPSLLGFKVHSNRIMMGEIQRPDD
ncbi:uncharacterized protein LOC110029136 isoform X2 [Phalaenopsis equestris]|uniref:uncharacterized protein LOC110029136 isoform X2 n=1 Tax=Phalaenopsis equestris TaxID=78828 RepID=UPI0009E1DFEE|nr:uncharacterized protein LOC110029136 isoform X2 [Phalaenopsis equestris]